MFDSYTAAFACTVHRTANRKGKTYSAKQTQQMKMSLIMARINICQANYHSGSVDQNKDSLLHFCYLSNDALILP